MRVTSKDQINFRYIDYLEPGSHSGLKRHDRKFVVSEYLNETSQEEGRDIVHFENVFIISYDFCKYGKAIKGKEKGRIHTNTFLWHVRMGKRNTMG